MRFFAVALLVSCSASTGGADVAPSPDGSAGAPVAAAGEPSEGSGTAAGAGGLTSEAGKPGGGGKAGQPVVATGGDSDPPPSGSGGGGTSSGGKANGGTGGTAGGKGGSSGAAGATSCPADFYCHPLGPDAFAKCVTRPADPDPQFPMCTITEGACFYPKTAPESCITPDCWSKKRTCP